MNKGLHHKYDVIRRDGKPVGGAFVIEYTDPLAPPVLMAYASLTRRVWGNHILANDLEAKALEILGARAVLEQGDAN